MRRNNLVQDALVQLGNHTFDLKKPLKVIFVGEEAIDEGGVTKEFFQLVVSSLSAGFGAQRRVTSSM